MTQDALDCAFDGDPSQLVVSAAVWHGRPQCRELDLGDHETQVSLATLKRCGAKDCRHARPAQHYSGLARFLSIPTNCRSRWKLRIERCIRVSSSARWMLAVSTPICRMPAALEHRAIALRDQCCSTSMMKQSADADVLSELAYATGGTFVQNSNDFEGGLRRLATPPEYSYLLAFSPQNLKFDGRFHNLKVTVKGPKAEYPGAQGLLCSQAGCQCGGAGQAADTG